MQWFKVCFHKNFNAKLIRWITCLCLNIFENKDATQTLSIRNKKIDWRLTFLPRCFVVVHLEGEELVEELSTGVFIIIVVVVFEILYAAKEKSSGTVCIITLSGRCTDYKIVFWLFVKIKDKLCPILSLILIDELVRNKWKEWIKMILVAISRN